MTTMTRTICLCFLDGVLEWFPGSSVGQNV